MEVESYWILSLQKYTMNEIKTSYKTLKFIHVFPIFWRPEGPEIKEQKLITYKPTELRVNIIESVDSLCDMTYGTKN